MTFIITQNTDSVDIQQKCLGLDATRSGFPRDVADHIHTNRGLHIQIRHNGDKQTFAQSVEIANLLASASMLHHAGKELLHWERFMGGFEGEAWDLLRDALNKARRG